MLLTVHTRKQPGLVDRQTGRQTEQYSSSTYLCALSELSDSQISDRKNENDYIYHDVGVQTKLYKVPGLAQAKISINTS